MRVSVSCSLPHPSTAPAAVPEPRSVEYVNRTLAVGAAMAPVSIIFRTAKLRRGPRRCPRKVACRMFPDYSDISNGFWLPTDRSVRRCQAAHNRDYRWSSTHDADRCAFSGLRLLNRSVSSLPGSAPESCPPKPPTVAVASTTTTSKHLGAVSELHRDLTSRGLKRPPVRRSKP